MGFWAGGTGRMDTEVAWRGGDRQEQSRWKRGYIQAVGSYPPLLIYLFPDGFWEGLTTGAVRKGWEGGNEGGREGRRAPGYRSGELAGSGRREGRRLSWAQPALRVEDPPRLEPPCSVRPGSPGFRGER